MSKAGVSKVQLPPASSATLVLFGVDCHDHATRPDDVIMPWDVGDRSESGPVADQPAVEQVELLVALENHPSRIGDRSVPVIDLEDGLDELSTRWTSSVRVPPRASHEAGVVGGQGPIGFIDRPEQSPELGILYCGRE